VSSFVFDPDYADEKAKYDLPKDRPFFPYSLAQIKAKTEVVEADYHGLPTNKDTKGWWSDGGDGYSYLWLVVLDNTPKLLFEDMNDIGSFATRFDAAILKVERGEEQGVIATTVFIYYAYPGSDPDIGKYSIGLPGGTVPYRDYGEPEIRFLKRLTDAEKQYYFELMRRSDAGLKLYYEYQELLANEKTRRKRQQVKSWVWWGIAIVAFLGILKTCGLI